MRARDALLATTETEGKATHRIERIERGPHAPLHLPRDAHVGDPPRERHECLERVDAVVRRLAQAAADQGVALCGCRGEGEGAGAGRGGGGGDAEEGAQLRGEEAERGCKVGGREGEAGRAGCLGGRGRGRVQDDDTAALRRDEGRSRLCAVCERGESESVVGRARERDRGGARTHPSRGCAAGGSRGSGRRAGSAAPGRACLQMLRGECESAMRPRARLERKREGEGEDAPRFHSALLTNARRSCSSTCAPSRPSSRCSGTASGAKYCTCVSTVKLWSGERDERSGRMWPARDGARERQLRRAFLDVEWREGNARERSSWASHERTALPAAESWLRRLKTSLMCGEYLTTRESALSVRVG